MYHIYHIIRDIYTLLIVNCVLIVYVLIKEFQIDLLSIDMDNKKIYRYIKNKRSSNIRVFVTFI